MTSNQDLRCGQPDESAVLVYALTSRLVANDKRDFLGRVNSIAQSALGVRQKATQ